MADLEKTWQLLLENFGEREYLDGAYYRLRHNPDGTYEIALIHGGPCGETLYAPRIMVSEALQPLELLDNYGTPVKFLTYQEAPAALDEALTDLIQKFLAAKGLNG